MLLGGAGDKDEDQYLKLNGWYRSLMAKSNAKLIVIGNELRAQGGAAHGLYPRER